MFIDEPHITILNMGLKCLIFDRGIFAYCHYTFI